MFQDAYQDILEQWISELRKEIPKVEIWWEATQSELEAKAEGLSRIHWPAGPAGHPRIIALFRKYYFEVHRLNLLSDLDLDDEDDDLEEGWGTDAEISDEDESGLAPVPPVTLLLKALPDFAPEEAQFMRKFVFIPIGEDPEYNVC